MSRQMHEGIADYLEIMWLAGVSEMKRATPRAASASPSVHANPPPPPKEERVSHSTHLREVGREVFTQGKGGTQTVCTPVPPRRLSTGSKADQLHCLAEEVAKCTRCKDLAAFQTQTVFGAGNSDSNLVFLGEAPGAEEDKQGEPFVGRAGQLLTDIIVKGMKFRREDVYICNILRCRPPGNRNPMPDEAANCRQFLDQTLEIIKPKFICCLGAVAAKNLLASEQTIGTLRGKVWEYRGIKVICTYHPAYLLRNPAAKKDTWEDIQLLMQEMKQIGTD